MEQAVTQRIRKVLKNKRLSISAFSETYGLKQRTVYNQLNGKTPLTIETFLSVINAFPELSTEWLLRGNGNITRQYEMGTHILQVNDEGDNFQGNFINNKGDCNKLIDMLAEKDRQISQLINIIQQNEKEK